jgi:membrane-associated phospholipid phosphatase
VSVLRLSPAFRRYLRELKYLLWLPLYLVSFAILEHLITTGYWATQRPIDQYIPFCPVFVIPYCLWYPLLVGVGVYLLVRDSAGFRRYMRFLSLTFFISVLTWVLLPNGQDLRPVVMSQNGLLTRLVALLYRLDTNTNVFPSVHVVGAVGAAWAVWDSPSLRQRRGLRWSVAVLAALICAATLFIKQHSVLDVTGGLLLSLAVGVPVYHGSLTMALRRFRQRRLKRAD